MTDERIDDESRRRYALRGYDVRSLLLSPIFDDEGSVIGLVELVNKEASATLSRSRSRARNLTRTRTVTLTLTRTCATSRRDLRGRWRRRGRVRTARTCFRVATRTTALAGTTSGCCACSVPSARRHRCHRPTQLPRRESPLRTHTHTTHTHDRSACACCQLLHLSEASGHVRSGPTSQAPAGLNRRPGRRALG